jgi:hypothetical protein
MNPDWIAAWELATEEFNNSKVVMNRIYTLRSLMDWDVHTLMNNVKATIKDGEPSLVKFILLLDEELEKTKHERKEIK